MKKIKNKLLLGFLILSGAFTFLNADQFIGDDLEVRGSLCVGFDCNNGENFGYDTIRLKENNLRIKFDDSSSTSSFPRNDWQIVVNDSTNGGESHFSVYDDTGDRYPFKIMAGAPNYSLYVAKSGYIGLKTTTPLVPLHMKYGNSPTVRLEQDGSSGFAEQVWDMGGNETNFFIRDVTNGSKLPFRIQPGAPNGAIFVANDGDIGFGTLTPDVGLDMVMSVPVIRMGNSQDPNGGGSWSLGAFPGEFAIFQSENGDHIPNITNSPLRIKRYSKGNSLLIDGTKVYINTDLSASKNVTVDGNLTVGDNIVATGSIFNASDKNLKENFKKVDYQSILQKTNKLDISLWNYKKEDKSIRHIGPMAQDFYSIFKVGIDDKTISALDAAAVAISGVKALSEQLEEKDAKIKALEEKIEELKKIELRVLELEEFMKKASIFTTTPNEKRSSKYQDSE